jgi:chemotaxis protein CheD
MSAEALDIRVGVADFAVSADGVISTIGLGSCVAIVLHDGVARVGGLAHVLLPSQTMSRDHTNPAKFPSTAVPLLLSEMVSLGARRERIKARLVGGASMFGGLLPSGGMNVGERNIAASREALTMEGVSILGEDVGSDYGRSVFLFTQDGRLEIRSLRKGSRVL